MDHTFLEYVVFLLSLSWLGIVFLLALFVRVRKKTVWYRLILLLTFFASMLLVLNAQGFWSSVKILFGS
jgi:hypothetical protein